MKTVNDIIMSSATAGMLETMALALVEDDSCSGFSEDVIVGSK